MAARREPDRVEEFGDGAFVGEDRLPGDGPDQVGGEERRDDREEHRVPPAPGLEGDRVGERIADQQRQQRRQAGVEEGADELRVVQRQRFAVVRPVPVNSRLADDARLEREPPMKTSGTTKKRTSQSVPGPSRK